MAKIIIATPAYGEIFYTPYVESLFKLVRALDRKKWPSDFSAVSYADIVESRNILMTHWYDKTDASHILFVDADMGFEPQLIFDMIEFNKPVTGVIYPKRSVDLNRLATLVHSGHPAKRAIADAHDFVVRQPKKGQPKKGFVEVEGAGAGILLIQRSCIDVMLKKMPTIIDEGPNTRLARGFDRFIRAFDHLTVDGLRLAEDYSFCHRWRHHCGGEVWANAAHEIVHIGVQRFKASYSDSSGPKVRVVQLPVTKIHKALAAKKDHPSRLGDRTEAGTKSEKR